MNCLLSNAETAANRVLRFTRVSCGSNGTHHVFCQVAAAALLTFGVASLQQFVTVVVLLRPQEQVVNVHAWRIVASVQDIQIARDVSVLYDPSKTMRKDASVQTGFNAQNAVSRMVFSAGPQNASAFVRFAKVSEEANFHRGGNPIVVTTKRAKELLARWACAKRTSALLTTELVTCKMWISHVNLRYRLAWLEPFVDSQSSEGSLVTIINRLIQRSKT